MTNLDISIVHTGTNMGCITWIFAALVSLDEAHYEEDQDEESYGTHQANKPALGGNVYLTAGYS